MPAAVILEETDTSVKHHNAKVVQVPRPVPRASEALIKIEAVALNHRELWIIENNYPVRPSFFIVALTVDPEQGI